MSAPLERCGRRRFWEHLASYMLVPCLAAAAGAAERIETEQLVVEIDTSRQLFSISDRVSSRTFVGRGTFEREIESVRRETAPGSPWGSGQQLTVTHVDGRRTSMLLYEKHPFVHIHTDVANRSDEPVSMAALDILEIDYDVGVPASQVRTLGTGGLRGADAPGSYTFLVAADPATRSGVVSGWLTHERGLGVLFPREAAGRSSIAARIEFGQFRIDPGETRPGETLVIGYFPDARLGLEAYADAVRAKYDIVLPPPPAVYCTWYHAGASSEQAIVENTRFAAEHLRPFGLAVMQIDDKWQALLPRGFVHAGKIPTTGPVKVFVDSRENYPRGMAHTAQAITSHGMVPGIWFMPFAGNFQHPYFDPDIFARKPNGEVFHDSRWSGTCLDLTHPKAQAFLADRVRRVHGWGYRYFKLDGLHTGAPSYNIYVHKEYRSGTIPATRLHDPRMTPVEAYRKGLGIVRENAPDTVILGCNVSQNMVSMGPAFGLIDAMRIGPDNGSASRGNWSAVKVGAWHGSNLYFLNGRVWHNDPDPVYVRESNPLQKARLMCSWVALSGSMVTTSYQFPKLPEERLELLRRALPPHGLQGRPVDLLESEQARIWLLTDGRRNVRRDTIGLFNWDEKKPVEIVYDMGKLGLDPERKYIAFDFWKNEFAGSMQRTLRQELPPGSCRVLAVRPAADHPQLLSTSRHIAQCVVDVLEERWDGGTRTLSGRSRVVGGDPYELRIVVPSRGSWGISGFSADGATISPRGTDPGGVRVSIEADETRVVDWKVRFGG